MNSFVDKIFVDNLHIMFGREFIEDKTKQIFNTTSPEFNAVMSNRIYNEEDAKTNMTEYVIGLLEELFHRVRDNKVGGNINKLEQVKSYIRNQVNNIKPKFYSS